MAVFIPLYVSLWRFLYIVYHCPHLQHKKDDERKEQQYRETVAIFTYLESSLSLSISLSMSLFPLQKLRSSRCMMHPCFYIIDISLVGFTSNPYFYIVDISLEVLHISQKVFSHRSWCYVLFIYSWIFYCTFTLESVSHYLHQQITLTIRYFQLVVVIVGRESGILFWIDKFCTSLILHSNFWISNISFPFLFSFFFILIAYVFIEFLGQEHNN